MFINRNGAASSTTKRYPPSQSSSTPRLSVIGGGLPETPEAPLARTGIAPFDERLGGLERGGTYLVFGAPGPEKMVAALQFVHAGLSDGERCLLVSNTGVDTILSVASAWGFDLRDAWRAGQLQLLGFKDDFELRAIRSIAPEEVLEELGSIAESGLSRIAVDPGTLFLTGGAKTRLGSSFLTWARGRSATVMATFSVDGGANSLPSSADWLVHATTGRLLLEKRGDGLHQMTLSRAVPDPEGREETILLELKAGAGLSEPGRHPARRRVDRGLIDESRLLLVSLGASHASDLEAWATRTFDADVVSEPFAAVARVQEGVGYGAVVVHAPRAHVRDAIQACRALRPLSRAAIVFASDDSVRSTDRIQILEAGADDCLSGGIDFRELGLRVKQAITTGARQMIEPAPEREEGGLVPPEAEEGRVPRQVFKAEVERRAADPELTVFCVLDVRSKALEPEAIGETLATEVRVDEGDIISVDPDHCAVLLQGAREGQLGPFLERLRLRIAEVAGGKRRSKLNIDVLSHPNDSDRIFALVGAAGAEES